MIHFLFHFINSHFVKQNSLLESFEIQVKALQHIFQPNFDKKSKGSRERLHLEREGRHLLLCKSLEIKVIPEYRPTSIFHLLF